VFGSGQCVLSITSMYCVGREVVMLWFSERLLFVLLALVNP